MFIKKAMKFIAASTIFLHIVTVASAQSKEEIAYKKESEQIRKEVWTWDKPEFKVREIPAQFANASKIVIARHTELTAESKSKFIFYGIGYSSKKELTISEVAREVIKLNDKKSVSEYSEISFTQLAKTSGFYSTSRTTTYVGIRVIKPNGSIKEINGDDIVLTKDEAKEKRAKLAVPDLDIGDVLDYFIATSQELTNTINKKEYNVFLFDDAPVLHSSFHAQLGKKYAIEYRSYNGAPDLKVSKNDDKEIIVDVEKKNIPAFETGLWVAPARQLPFIRMSISLGYRGPGAKALRYSPPGEVIKCADGEAALDDLAGSLSLNYYNNYWMKPAKVQFDLIESDAKSLAKQMGVSFKDLSDQEKALFLFYTFRFNRLLDFSINNMGGAIRRGQSEYNGFAFVLFCIMKAAGLDPIILVAESKNGFRFDETMESEDFFETMYLPTSSNFFGIYSIYDLPLVISQSIEGSKQAKSFTFDHPGMIMSYKKAAGLTNIAPGFKVLASTSDKNTRRETLKISIAADNAQLAVKRNTILKGYYKKDVQRDLILYEDYYEAERQSFKMEKSLIEQLEDGKKTKKNAAEVKNAFAEARKKQKDAFVAEAKDWFEQDVSNLIGNKVENLGVRHTSPDFIYSSSFNLGGLIKKGGNNLIIEVGKLQGQPLTIKEEQRKRDLDVYMPFARAIEYEIELTIPDGYTAEGVEALNVDVSNETGMFKVAATLLDKTVTIRVKKHYLHSFEKAADFGKLMEFMDASGTWTNAKLLLKKK